MQTIDDVIQHCVAQHIQTQFAQFKAQLREELTAIQTQTPILVRVADLVPLLNLSRTEIYGLINRGELASFRVGKARMIRYQDVIAFIEKKAKEDT